MPLLRKRPRPKQLRLKWLSAEVNLHVQEWCRVCWRIRSLMRWYTLANNAEVQSILHRFLVVLLFRRDRVQRSLLQRRQFAPSAGPFRRMCHFQDDQEFRDLFRFRRAEFHDLLKQLRLVAADGKPLTVKVGRNGHRSTVPADWCLMVLLNRLSYPCRYADLARRFGGSRTTCCEGFLYLLTEMDQRFGHVVLDVARFLSRATARHCCDIMENHDDNFGHVLGFVDTKFVKVQRPGGPRASLFDNIDQRLVYSGEKKAHGLKYQVLELANGLSITTRAYPGGEADSTILGDSGWLLLLESLSRRLGFDPCMIGDCAYARSRNLVRKNRRHEIHRIPAWEADALNEYRVLVENAFAHIHNNWGFLSHKYHLTIAMTPFDRMWRVSMLLHNLQTISYGNQTTDTLGYFLHNWTYSSYLNG